MVKNDPHFIGILKLEPDPTDTTNTRLIVANKNPFGFVDDEGVLWTVHTGDVTDGASIPGIVKPLFGRSFEIPYLQASVIHDVYCKNKGGPEHRTWQKTAEMFREAVITGGTNRFKAWTMWAAVYKFGPRW